MAERALSRADFVWLIGSLCQVNRLPFDAALILQRFPEPHSTRQLLEALQALDFRTGEGALAKAALPCIAFLKDGKPAIVVKADGTELLCFEAGSQTPARAAIDRFETRALLMASSRSATPRAKTPIVSSDSATNLVPARLMEPKLGLIAKVPQ